MRRNPLRGDSACFCAFALTARDSPRRAALSARSRNPTPPSRCAYARGVNDLPPIDSPLTLKDWHFPWPAGERHWKKAALLIIDMQNYGCNPDMGLGPMLAERHPRTAGYYLPRLTETVIPNVTRLVAAFRLAGQEVVFTRHGPLLADGRDMIGRRRRRDVDARAATDVPALWHRGTVEHELIDLGQRRTRL